MLEAIVGSRQHSPALVPDDLLVVHEADFQQPIQHFTRESRRMEDIAHLGLCLVRHCPGAVDQDQLRLQEQLLAVMHRPGAGGGVAAADQVERLIHMGRPVDARLGLADDALVTGGRQPLPVGLHLVARINRRERRGNPARFQSVRRVGAGANLRQAKILAGVHNRRADFFAFGVGTGTPTSVTVAAGTTLTALAAQLTGNSAFTAAGLTASATSTPGSLVITGPTTGANAAANTVSFAGCTLAEVDFTNVSCTKVDLRGASLGITAGYGSLSGATIDSVQLVALAPYLARHLGLVVAD